MLYRFDFAQKKNGTFLVAASAVNESKSTRPEVRFQANPYRDAETFLSVVEAAGCSDHATATIREAINQAEVRLEVPITCEPVDLETRQLAALGLGEAAAPSNQHFAFA